ncbi:hypothetical protein [Halopiger thermotolerans]
MKEETSDRCIWEVMQDLQCKHDSLENYNLCKGHLKTALQEFESLCAFLIVCDDEGQVSSGDEERYQYYRDLLTQEGINADAHYDEIKRIYTNYDEGQATHMMETVQEEFLAEHLPDYDAQY